MFAACRVMCGMPAACRPALRSLFEATPQSSRSLDHGIKTNNRKGPAFPHIGRQSRIHRIFKTSICSPQPPSQTSSPVSISRR